MQPPNQRAGIILAVERPVETDATRRVLQQGAQSGGNAVARFGSFRRRQGNPFGGQDFALGLAPQTDVFPGLRRRLFGGGTAWSRGLLMPPASRRAVLRSIGHGMVR